MAWLTFASAIAIVASAGVMLASIFHVRSVLDILALAAEPHRSWLSHHVRLQRRLMYFVFVGYLTLAAALLGAMIVITEPLFAAVSFFAAVFVHTGIAIQDRMATALLKTLQGLIPICAWCKRVRTREIDGEGQPLWESVETYIVRRTEVDFTHGICADCARTLEAGQRRPAPSPLA